MWRRVLVRSRNNVRGLAVAAAHHSDAGLPDLVITPLAAKKLAQAATTQHTPNLQLRIAVEGGGCSGFKYVFEFEDDAKAEAEDVLFEQHGGRVVVDKESLDLIRGSTLDYEEEMMRSAFVVQNPRATSSCGCGTSFDMKDGEGDTEAQ